MPCCGSGAGRFPFLRGRPCHFCGGRGSSATEGIHAVSARMFGGSRTAAGTGGRTTPVRLPAAARDGQTHRTAHEPEEDVIRLYREEALAFAGGAAASAIAARAPLLQAGLYGWEVTDCLVSLTKVGYERPLSVAAHLRNLTRLACAEQGRRASRRLIYFAASAAQRTSLLRPNVT
jgi:hypothetical protein